MKSVRRFIIASLTLAIAGGVIWRFGISSPSSATVTPQAPEAVAKRDQVVEASRTWVSRASAMLRPVESTGDFLPAEVRPLLEERESKPTADHAAAEAARAVFLLLKQRDWMAHSAWRKQRGYALPAASDLREDSGSLRFYEKLAGRTLTDEASSVDALFQAAWQNAAANEPRIVAVGQAGSGYYLVEGRLPKAISQPGKRPDRELYTDLLSDHPSVLEAMQIDYDGIRGTRAANGWPLWKPPLSVRDRIERSGTRLAQVGWLVKLSDGSTAPLNVQLAWDESTRQWWIVQFFVYQLEAARSFNTFGL